MWSENLDETAAQRRAVKAKDFIIKYYNKLGFFQHQDNPI